MVNVDAMSSLHDRLTAYVNAYGMLFLGCTSIFGWDTTSSSGSAGCAQVSNNDESATYNVSMEFGLPEGLSDNCQMVVISEVERILVFDESRNWSLKNG